MAREFKKTDALIAELQRQNATLADRLAQVEAAAAERGKSLRAVG